MKNFKLNENTTFLISKKGIATEYNDLKNNEKTFEFTPYQAISRINIYNGKYGPGITIHANEGNYFVIRTKTYDEAFQLYQDIIQYLK